MWDVSRVSRLRDDRQCRIGGMSRVFSISPCGMSCVTSVDVRARLLLAIARPGLRWHEDSLSRGFDSDGSRRILLKCSQHAECRRRAREASYATDPV